MSIKLSIYNLQLYLPLGFISSLGSLLQLGGGNLESLLRSFEILLDELGATVHGSNIGFGLWIKQMTNEYEGKGER